ncbi:serine/threonine protein kinase [Nocardia higoensis]|uniref:non-specific serine/threonine protein kinase n=1 Tax=Nocardia higoensis TaxID=228599 RepID=A0ABS0DCM6_9NOCA|nr:serine/threonine-protein kinase [Nocardia higoensis]MBF6356194.1 serine/threonine protein kinase [Nocardia higoensis]
MALRPGAIVGGYRVIQTLGSGGMGTVYLAQNPILPRRDALKVLSSDLSTDDEFRARFEREANLAAGLDHPNIVAVYNRGEEDGQLWIAMQYVDGTDASEETAKGPAVMTPQRALRIATEVGKGLDYAHRRGLLHRDIKPANFLLSAVEADDEERVLLTDFGVAKSAEDGQDLTATGKFMATVAYASPEQLLGERLDHRSDIYSLGCSFYRMLTGQNPYPSTVPAVVMMGHLHEAPPKPSVVRYGLPVALDAVMAKVLAKNPADRYATCKEFVQDAEAALSGRPPARAPISDPHIPLQQLRSQPQVGTAIHPVTATYTPTVSPYDETDQHLVDTLRNGKPPRSKGRVLLLPAIVSLVVAVVVAAGTYFLTRPDAAGDGADLIAAVRSEYPQFAGKSVTAFNFGDASLSAVLTPSTQARFLQDIGFTYSSTYKAVGQEESPRPLSLSSYANEVDSEVVIVLRSDKEAGNGGLRGLPSSILNSGARIVVVDDLATVQAFQVWTDQSTATLVDKMVPVIGKVVTG